MTIDTVDVKAALTEGLTELHLPADSGETERDSGGSRTAFRAEGEQYRSVATLAF